MEANRSSMWNSRLLPKALALIGLFLLSSGYAYAQTCQAMDLGNVANLNGYLPFSGNPNNLWNQNILNAPLDPNSAAIIAGIPVSRKLHPDFGPDGGIPYVVVDSSVTPAVNMEGPAAGPPGPNASQSEGLVEPAPITAPIEGGWPDCLAYPNAIYLGDTHMLVVDRRGCWLYETYLTDRCNGVYNVTGQTLWDLKTGQQRPWGWTSSDAAGLPVFAGLVKYDEATNGVPNPSLPTVANGPQLVPAGYIQHAFRFTMEPTKGDGDGGYFVPPATHAASYGSHYSSLNVMGMRLRLKSDEATNEKVASYSPINQSILIAMQQYGLILADNGSDMFVQGTTDPRWNTDDLGNWHGGPNPILPTDFEVVQMTPEGMNTSDPAGTPAAESYSYLDANSAPYTVQDVEDGTYPGGLGPEGTSLGLGGGGANPTTGADTAGPSPTIISFTASNTTVSAGQGVQLNISVSNDTYDYVDNAGPVRLTPNGGGPGINTGSIWIHPQTTQIYTLNSMNAYGISQSGQAYAYSPNPAAPMGMAPPSITVTVPGSAAPVPVFTPQGGTYNSIQQVVITVPGYPQAQIYYTTDGLTAPTVSSTQYTGPITVANATSTNSQYITGEEIQALAVVPGLSGLAPSQVAAATYVVSSQAAAPTFSLPGGTYNTSQMVTLADATVGVDYAANGDGPSIFFTTDGTPPSVVQATPSGDPLGTFGWVPNTASTQIYCYTNFSNEGNYSTTPTAWDADGSGCAQTTDDLIPMNITASTTINAIAVAVGYTPSAVATATYTLPIAFNLSATPSTVTLVRGTGSVIVTVTGQNGFNSAVALACTDLPLGYTCNFSPSSVTPVAGTPATSTTSATSMLTISPGKSMANARHSGSFFPGATLAVALCLFGLRKRRRLQMLLLLAVSMVGLGLFTGCTGNKTFTSTSVLVTVTGTSGTSAVDTTFTLQF